VILAPGFARSQSVLASVDPADGDIRELERILDTAVEAFVSIDVDGRVLAWNRAAQTTFGWRREEVLGADVAELIVPDRFRAAHRAGMRRLRETGRGRVMGSRLELWGLHRDGHELPIEMTLSAVEVAGALRFHAFLHCVAERRAAEEQARRLSAIVESSADAIVSGTADGIIETWNPGAERLYGYRAEEVVGRSIALLRPDGADDEVMGTIRARLRAGEPVRDFETRERHKDGTLLDVSLTLSPLRGPGGEVRGITSITRDIGERDRLRDAQERFAGAFAHAPIGMALVDLDGRFLTVNPALARSVGRTAGELQALSFGEITLPADREAGLRRRAELLAGERDAFEGELRLVRGDGTTVWVHLAVSTVRGADGAPSYCVAQLHDVTARKSAERHLRHSAERLARLGERDPATGLPHRTALLERLEDAVASGPGSVVVVRLGEDPLREADALRGACLPAETAGMANRGEVAVVLPAASRAEAEAVAGRLRRAVATATGRTPPVPGVASWRSARTSAPRLLARASAAVLVPDGDDAAGPTVSPRVQRILELARTRLGLDVAFLGELAGSELVFRGLAGEAESFGLSPGATLPAADSLCHRMVAGDIPQVVPDTAADPVAWTAPVTQQAGIGAYVGVPLVLTDGSLFGTLCCLDHEAQRTLGANDLDLLRFLADLLADALADEVAGEHRQRSESEGVGIHALLAALEARDQYTGDHSKDVVELAVAVARRLGLTPAAIAGVEQVAVLHDIGKVGIPDAVLQKQGRLDEDEWELMRQHPVIGERVVAGTPGLAHLASAIRAEHERYDGQGYPDGLRGEEIPLSSRITFACDAYHAMVSDRPYRPRLPEARAQEELRARSGTQFDPAVVSALLAVLEGRSDPGQPR
jgi:PAS domain S-box-containing protein